MSGAHDAARIRCALAEAFALVDDSYTIFTDFYSLYI